MNFFFQYRPDYFQYNTPPRLSCSKYENAASTAHALELVAKNETLDEGHDCHSAGCQRIIINVSGAKYETQLRTLNRFPDTLLGDPIKRRQFWDGRRNEFFIDRHRPSFQAVLYYYQSGGRLRRPIEVPEDIFLEELEFYEIGDDIIKDYKEKEGFLMEEEKPMPVNSLQKRLWMFLEEPDSSKSAKVFALVSVACIVASIVNFCMETLPMFERPDCVNSTTPSGAVYQVKNYNDPFFVVESMCVAWFTLEFILRYLSCPSKWEFSKSLMNIFDVMAILPFFVILIMNMSAENCTEEKSKGGSLIVIRVLRVFRVFKLSKHSQGLRILGLTIKSSMRELGMFFFFLLVAMVIFSSAAYYADLGEKDSEFESIPGAFWWAIVTMTTVGYGDVTPVGVWGKLVGAVCVIAGVLTIALPVPVVVANFNNFYRHDSGRGKSYKVLCLSKSSFEECHFQKEQNRCSLLFFIRPKICSILIKCKL
ncbi:DgyrCDS8143 [Dimorphilus gyrociliatus]|uniref:DgyrCDS8143 n=1 Tax=Dimorphilus gyrociliatus TaxID=2664684 RepID=A0A7I8VTH8_9ANNE|nr:DgyrCDS8143 [Dimorphilus gyrociliatus]